MEIKNYVLEEEVEEEEVKWVKHYSSMHEILLVGEGDFSFSLSLANAFGTAINIVATSYDSYDTLLKKYSKAQFNVKELKKMGATVVHDVDATKMKLFVGLRVRKFDRIVFNFPHAGFKGKEHHPRLIKMHRELVRGFFRNASHMLRPYGEVHISHKTAAPFSHWNLEELAAENSLLLLECVDFCIEDYPGYNNKRGDGHCSDNPFPLGKCSTFKFIIGHLHKKKNHTILNHFGHGSISIDNSLRYSTNVLPPVSFERMPRSFTMHPPITGISNGLEFSDTIPRPFPGIESFDLALPPWGGINHSGLRMHDLELSSYSGVSLRIRTPLNGYNAEFLEAPRREPLGFDYWRDFEEIRRLRETSLECGRMAEWRAEWDEEARWRQLCLGYGI